MIICAGRNETFEFATPIGVGLIESAITLTRYLEKHRPEFLLFVGTAGSYGHHNIFDMVYSHTAANIELGYFQHQCYTPLTSVIEANHKYVPRETLLPFVSVNSSNYITTQNELTHHYRDNHIDIENMEFFSIVSVANAFDIPCLGLFCITNFCHHDAHKEFMAHHAEAKRLLTQQIQTLFN